MCVFVGLDCTNIPSTYMHTLHTLQLGRGISHAFPTTFTTMLFITFQILILSVFGLVNCQEDVFSRPEYLINKEGYVRRLNLNEEIAKFSQLGGSHEIIALKNNSYVCFIPNPPLEESSIYELLYPPGMDYDQYTQQHISFNQNKKKDELSEEHIKETIDTALDLLLPLHDKCLYTPWGWWTCSFCYGKEVVQFHQSDTTDKTKLPKPDEGSVVYTLGKFESLVKEKNGEEMSIELLRREMGKNLKDIKIESSGSTHYLVYHLGQGTMCQLAGSERTIDVQFYCSPESKTDKIAWVKELRSCHYQVVIYTPRLCEIPLFVPQPQSGSHTVNCKVILEDEESVLRYYIDHLEENIDYFQIEEESLNA